MTEYHGNIPWRSDELIDAAPWHYVLDAADLAEIDRALRHAASRKAALEHIGAADFPLPALARHLAAMARELEHGMGAVRIRGLPVERYDESEQRLLFWGLAQYLGRCVSQSESGELIMNIRDAGLTADDPTVRGVHSRGGLQYHTDLCDVVGMLSLHCAAEGGQSLLVSSIAVHDEIARTRPDLLAALYRPYCYARPGWDGQEYAAPDLRPVFACHDGRFVSTYLRDFIEWAQDDAGAAPLEAVQREALDYLDMLCNDPRFSFEFMLEQGELLFFNSFVTYHSRRPFANPPERARHRNLLRLWLSTPDSRALPPCYAGAFGAVEAGALRGGIQARATAGVAA